MPTPKTVYVVGAGFSHHAGLPLQCGFTEKLLEPRDNTDDPDHALVKRLSEFVNAVFDHKVSAKHRYWPDLEDIFTCIDLSANTGHHLGNLFAPSGLRTVRRTLLTRIINMLHRGFREAQERNAREWKQLKQFVKKIDIEQSAFISINWDTVIELCMQQLRAIDYFDYRCMAAAGVFPREQGRVALRKKSSPRLSIVKIHGSINWLYCDNCRRLYWFAPDECDTIAEQLLSVEEWAEVDPQHRPQEKRRCSRCHDVSLTTRIATFSYLKALDYPMFQRSWLSAERILRAAERWVFIGYSLPAADYEFKYLLKRVQISCGQRPEIILITGGKDPSATYDNYQRFFGRVMQRTGYFPDGLTEEAIEAITSK